MGRNYAGLRPFLGGGKTKHGPEDWHVCVSVCVCVCVGGVFGFKRSPYAGCLGRFSLMSILLVCVFAGTLACVSGCMWVCVCVCGGGVRLGLSNHPMLVVWDDSALCPFS